MKTRTSSQTAVPDSQTPDAFFKSSPDSDLKSDMRMEINSFFIFLERGNEDLTDPKVKHDLPWRVACRLRDEQVGGWVGLDLHHMKCAGNKMIKAMHDSVRYQLRRRTSPQNSYEPEGFSSSQSSSGHERPGSDEKVR